MNNYRLKNLLKILLLVMAVGIALISLLYTNLLVEDLKEEERAKARIWAEAIQLSAAPSNDQSNSSFPLSVVQANNTIPVIAAFADGTIITFKNLDTIKAKNPAYLQGMLLKMKKDYDPIELDYFDDEKIYIYYQHSILLTKLKYYPFVQLSVIGLFLILSYFAFSYSRRSEQNQVWVGMSKETAHQLGTPISSLMAWMEILKEGQGQISEEMLNEMGKDIERLELITERFSKIGSDPILVDHNLLDVVTETVGYLQKRTSNKVVFEVKNISMESKCKLNVPLFAWVIENITKNAIDAMSGMGNLYFEIIDSGRHIVLEISDTGKGIPNANFKTIFKPGFTTKKRGWGLGLSLVKRIVENYHNGEIIVKESIPNKRTTFRITLNK